MELSIQRAEAVKQALIQKFNISPLLLQTKGFGETKPLVPNTTPENRQKNRRVEITAIPN